MELHRTHLNKLRRLTSQVCGPEGARDHKAVNEDWTALECMRLLYWHRATIVWIMCMGGAIAALISIGPPIYESRAVLEIGSYNETFLDLQETYPFAASRIEGGLSMQTQVELLQQDLLLEEVARKLRLQERPEFQPLNSLVWKLHEAVAIAPVKGSRLIQIICEDTDPSVAADLANTLAQTFIEHEIQAQRQSARETYDELRLQLRAVGAWALENSYHLTPRLSRMPPSPGPERYANESILHALKRKAETARLGAVMGQSDLRLAAPAEPSSRPFRPNVPLNFAIGMAGGLVIAIGGVMLYEQDVLPLRERREARVCLGVPELGAIPNYDGPTLLWQAVPTGNDTGPEGGRAAVARRSSRFLESFRSVAASISSMQPGRSRILAFTSSRPQEGKTTVVSNLGVALAEMGSKVLLIDGETRQPQLHRLFGAVNDWGWSDYLHALNATGEAPLDLRIKTTRVPGLFLLPGGTRNNEIFPGLCPDQTYLPLSWICRDFEYVLVDAPPLTEFTASGQIARNADGVVLVVRANRTSHGTIHTAVQQLERRCPPVVGFIFNRFGPFHRDHDSGSILGANPPQQGKC